jgi:hypothetical protein
MYLRIKDGNIEYPYTFEQLRLDAYNISFPENISDSLLEEFGVYNVVKTTKPNDYTKNISEATPTIIDGIYYQIWNQIDASSDEINARITQKWEEIRDHRNTLLKECDWTVLIDSPLSGSVLQNWKTYRQELRDVTSQENPFNINWPTQP